MKRWGKVTRRDPVEIERRNQRIDAGHPAQVRRRDRAAKLLSVSMTNSWLPNLDRANAGYQFPFRMISIAYGRSLSVFDTSLSIFFQILGHFIFDSPPEVFSWLRRSATFPGSPFLHLGLALKQNYFNLLHWCILSFGASSEYAGFVFGY